MKLALAAALAALSVAAPAPARDAAPIVEAALTPYLGRLMTVEVKIDGRPARLLLDTGGGVSGVTPEFAAKLGCKPYGSISGFRMSGERLRPQKCGERRVEVGAFAKSTEVLVYDLMSLLPPGTAPVDGVLGLDVFENQAVTLDLGDRRLTVESPASLAARTQGRPSGPIHIMREMGGLGLTTFAKVKAQQGTLWFLLDSGNLGATQVSPGALEQLGVPADKIGDVAKHPEVVVAVRIDGAADGPEKVRANDIIYDGALNERFIHHHDLTLDLKNARAWYVPDPKPQGK